MLKSAEPVHTDMTFLRDYQPTPYDVKEVRLCFRLDDEMTRVTSELLMHKREGTKSGASLVLNGRADLEGLSINAQPLNSDDYRLEGERLEIFHLPSQPFTLSVKTAFNPKENKQCMGLYYTDGVFCTQCEPEGFRHITYFYDRPDIMAVYWVRIEGQKSSVPQLLSNGNLIDSGDLEGGYHFAEWHDPHPKPCYLFALVAADLGVLEDHFRTSEGRDVVLHIFVAKGDENKALWAMEALKKSMAWDEKRFGRAYDLDLFMIVAVSAFNFGAMENKGLNIFNDRYVLADPETATDRIYERIEAIVAHEYFHNWTGDRVTCRDWFQLCVKEGLTVYRDQEFTADLRSRAVKRIEDVEMIVSRQWTEDDGPLAHPPRPDRYQQIDNFYTVTVYEKGAEIVRMLAVRLGDEGFRKGMDLYFGRYDNRAVTVEDFLQALGDANGCDLMPFLAWYKEAGTPIVEVGSVYDAGAKTFHLTLTPKPPEGAAVTETVGKPIPIRLGFLDQAGNDIALPQGIPCQLADDMVELGAEPVTITVPNQDAALVPSVLRGFSAPVKIRQMLDLDQKIHLIRYDNDPYVRYEAMRQAVIDVHMKALDNFSSSIDALHRLQDVRADLLLDKNLDGRFKKMIVGCGFSFNDFRAQFKEQLPLDAYYDLQDKKREFAPSDKFRAAVQESFAALPDIQAPYSPDGVQVELRAFKACLLGLLASFQTEDALELVRWAYASAPNLTERLAALGALNVYDRQNIDIYLADFRKLIGDNVLIFDNYLALQVHKGGDNDLESIKDVMNDPLYNRDNPNRVRSLLGVLVGKHGKTFHHIGGAGYQFIISEAERLDVINPSLAAGLIKGFDILPKLDEARRLLIIEGLERLRSKPLCSSNLKDFIDRIV